jgi:hypothetical protein
MTRNSVIYYKNRHRNSGIIGTQTVGCVTYRAKENQTGGWRLTGARGRERRSRCLEGVFGLKVRQWLQEALGVEKLVRREEVLGLEVAAGGRAETGEAAAVGAYSSGLEAASDVQGSLAG